MPPASRRAVRFVRALLPAGVARCATDGVFRTGPGPSASLEAVTVADLIGHGVLAGDRDQCCPGPDVRTWLRRQLLGGETPLAAQHRLEVTEATGVVRNLAESPLSRLATTQNGAGGPFLAPHQVEAGERLRRLVERAQLRARVTMSYDPTRTPGAPGTAAELGDFAADARRTLASVMQQLPADCADVVLDVCGLEKGLQQIEQERGWPRRSAKLVLRIGLEQLARQFGLSPLAVGNDGGRARNWMGQGARPEMFAGD